MAFSASRRDPWDSFRSDADKAFPTPSNPRGALRVHAPLSDPLTRVSKKSTSKAGAIRANSSTGLSRGRKVTFSVVATALPFVLLVVLEVGLRLVGYGSHPPLVEEVEGYPGFIQPREDVAARYFSSIANLPSIPFDWLSEPRPDSTFRIVFQGGSTAAGWPYYFSADMADVTENHLRSMHPAFRFEVMNTSMAAVNSYTLLDLSGEIIALEPDAVLIYAGHNEFYGALGVGSSQAFGSGPALINLYLGLRSFRTVQLLQNSISAVIGLFVDAPSDEGPGRTLMQDMVGEQRIAYDSDLYLEGLEQFRSNLGVLLERYEEAGIPVYIGTLASNLRDQPPFLSGSARMTTDQAEAAVRSAANALSRGDTTGALSQLDELLAQAPDLASAHFIRGRALETLGRIEEAKAAYLAAKEHDELRFRAPEAFNDIIRELAAAHGAAVVETQQAMEEASPFGLIGSDMMLEHLHPTIPGYRILGSAFFMGLAGNQFGQDQGLRWAWDAALAQSRALTPVPRIDSLAGAYRVQQLTASWPFQPIGSRLTRIDTLMAGTLEGELGLKLFRDDLPRIEALDAVRRSATENGDLSKASIHLEAVIQSYPMVPGPHLALAKIRMQEGRLGEAERLAHQELANGENAEAYQIAGTLALNNRSIDNAAALLERAVALNPADLRARYNLAGAYALLQRYDEARSQAEEILRRNPAADDARRLLISLPQ